MEWGLLCSVMALKTPFFHAFGPLLFGRAKAQVNRSLRDLKGLDDLYSVFGDLFPEKLLDPTAKGTNSRQRRLPPVVTFWAFVAQVLSPKTSCREIVHRIEKKGTGNFIGGGKGDRQLFGFKTHFRKGKRGARKLFKLFRLYRICSATALFPDVLKSHP